ncbi:MAG TPA: hypothetical protein VEY08_01395, partial [Chloroflexia bacterium]|nr:hypothetical protein [Chloroflexia bacterium]
METSSLVSPWLQPQGTPTGHPHRASPQGIPTGHPHRASMQAVMRGLFARNRYSLAQFAPGCSVPSVSL